MDEKSAHQAPHLQIGQSGEDLAAHYLEQRGWTIVARNYESQRGEIDIIASRPINDGSATEVIFVEVKSRTDAGQTPPHLSVTHRKRRRITRIGRDFADRHGQPQTAYRFDVIGVDFGSEPPELHHFEGAFDARGNPY